MDNIKQICIELANLAKREHYFCEDSWYSCPKAEGGCANDAEGDECTCGADAHNAKVNELLAAALAKSEPQRCYLYNPVQIAECGGPCQQGPEHCDCGELCVTEPASEPPTDGEVVELVAWLLEGGEDAAANGWDHQARQFTRAAELLQLQHPQPDFAPCLPATDFRALCAELLSALETEGYAHWVVIPDEDELCLRARAALAEPEPKEPTDEEILELMPQQMRDDLAAAARALAGFDPDNFKAASVFRIILNRHSVDHSRAVLSRWGNHPVSPDSSTPQPIPVTERLPGAEDCVVISWSEIRSPHVWAGKRRLINGPTEIWDWTFVSIPCLEESGEFTHWLPASASVLPAGAIRQSNPSA